MDKRNIYTKDIFKKWRALDLEYKVYMHYIKDIDKYYIGMTCNTLAYRFSGGYKECRLFQEYIEMYGWENIDSTLLYKFKSKEEAMEKEKELILYYSKLNKSLNLYIEDNYVVSEETKRKISEKNLNHSKKSKKIIQINKYSNIPLQEFESISEASRKTGISIQSLSFCCNGKYNTAGGFKWSFK